MCTNDLWTIFHEPSIRLSVKKSTHETVPQKPSSTTTALAASPICCTDVTRARKLPVSGRGGLRDVEELGDRHVVARAGKLAVHPGVFVERYLQQAGVACGNPVDVEAEDTHDLVVIDLARP